MQCWIVDNMYEKTCPVVLVQKNVGLLTMYIPEGGDYRIEETGALLVSLKGVECLGQNSNVFF